MKLTRVGIGTVVCSSAISCALTLSFDGYERSDASRDGGVGEASRAGFNLVVENPELVLARDSPGSLVVRAIRDPGFEEPITFDPAASSSNDVHVTLGPATGDVVSASVTGTVVGPARVTVTAHAPGRAQSVDIAVSIRPTAGDLDPQFGDGGTTEVRTPSGSTFLTYGVVVDDADAIVAGVTEQPSQTWELRRWTREGRRDSNFGDGGTAIVAVAAGDGADSLVRSSDARFLVGGPRSGFGTVRRVLANGELDETYGDGGSVFLPVRPPFILVADGLGALVVGLGTASAVTTILRLQPTGALDQSYGDAGVAVVAFSDTLFPRCGRRLVNTGDLVFGSVLSDSVSQPQASRLGPNGEFVSGNVGSSGRFLECAVNASGEVVFTSNVDVVVVDAEKMAAFTNGAQSFFDEPRLATAFDPSGRIVLAGVRAGALAVLRLLPDGSPDRSFHSPGLEAGVLLTRIPQDTDSNTRVAIRADGEIILATQANPTTLTLAAVLP